MKRLEHGLVYDAAQSDQIIRIDFVGMFLGLLQSLRAPVDRMGLGQTPVERAVFFVHLLGEFRINFVFFTQEQRIGAGRGRRRVDQVGEVGSARSKKRVHFILPLVFVI